jgi:hypothetical protein
MNYNYTLKYRTFNSLLEDVRIDLKSLTTEGSIDPAQLYKVAMRVNYDLGLRIAMTKEKVLVIEKGRVRLPDDFFVMNFALLCGNETRSVIVPQGTQVQEVVPEYRPWIDQLPCTNESNLGETVCLSKCGKSYSLIQVIKTEERRYDYLEPVVFKNSEFIDCDCPNLHYRGKNVAYIKDGWLYLNMEDAKMYINYQGAMENDEGELMVPDHPMINEYYEYAVKKRVLENLLMDGSNVSAQLQLVMGEYRAARNYALSIVNTPNFSEMQKVWTMNRKAMYSKYYDMFKSYFQPTNFTINNAV